MPVHPAPVRARELRSSRWITLGRHRRLPMAQNTTVVWAQFPSHEAAEKIKARLTDNGFARNSIELYRNTDDSCDLAVHTSEKNLERVESLLHTSAPVYAFRQFRSGAFKTAASHPLVIGGGI